MSGETLNSPSRFAIRNELSRSPNGESFDCAWSLTKLYWSCITFHSSTKNVKIARSLEKSGAGRSARWASKMRS